MRILLNGEPRDLSGELSIRALLEELDLDAGRVAVELNRRILKRGEFDGVLLREGDEVELVTFVGGG